MMGGVGRVGGWLVNQGVVCGSYEVTRHSDRPARNLFSCKLYGQYILEM